MKDFDSFHRDFHREFRSTRRLALIWGTAYTLFGVGVFVALGYVAWHFLARVW